jgi:hypothetical protein
MTLTEKSFFLCDCSQHAIQVEYDPEWGVSMAFWQAGHEGFTRSWKQRVKHIWRILRFGHPYADAVTWVPGRTQELSDLIDALTDVYDDLVELKEAA